jgi:nicotinamidase-related amidase
MKYVILVDVQKGFVTGNLGTPEAVKAVNFIKNYLKNMDKENTALIFTQDTHHEDTYMNTMEGKKLPVPHCLLGTEDWEIVDSLDNIAEEGFFVPNVAPFCNERGRVFKETFGSIDLINLLYHLNDCGGPVEEIIVAGVCTGICVISNVLLLKAAFPNVPIKVVEQGCACVTPESHETALKAMEMCHIDIIR